MISSALSITDSSGSSVDGSQGQKQDRRGQKGAKSLPCFTHLSTGSCIYGDHCRFIHDKYVASPCVANTTLEQRNNVDHKIRDDPVYWPPAYLPQVKDEYTLDPKIVFHDDLRYKAIFSMWTFFVGSIGDNSRDWPNYSENPVTKRSRLPIFQKLAEGLPANSEDIPSLTSISAPISRSHKLTKTIPVISHGRRHHSTHATNFVDIASHHTSRMSA